MTQINAKINYDSCSILHVQYMQAFLLSELCGDIKIRTENWGNENSYSVGTCASSQSPYSSYNDYVEECCLRPGTYTLDCKCTFGDGWHGGYLEIAGVRYCDDFLYGSTQTVAVEWGS